MVDNERGPVLLKNKTATVGAVSRTFIALLGQETAKYPQAIPDRLDPGGGGAATLI